MNNKAIRLSVTVYSRAPIDAHLGTIKSTGINHNIRDEMNLSCRRYRRQIKITHRRKPCLNCVLMDFNRFILRLITVLGIFAAI